MAVESRGHRALASPRVSRKGVTVKKIVISLSAFVGAILAVALIGLSLFVHALTPPVRETRVPGDTNCDGKLDMSDAIFTLNYLFQGTAFPPCPLADPPALVARIAELEAEIAKKSADLEDSTAQLAEKDAQLMTCQADLARKFADLEASSAQVLSLQADLAEKNAKLGTCQAELSECTVALSTCGRLPALPDTGQTKCYDQGGAEISCASATCPGQDGQYAMGCLSQGRFVDNGDGTVTDTCTGLMWQKDTADTNGEGQIDDADRIQWCAAIAYCEHLSFAGHDNWRLPNVRELQSIVDYGRFNPSIDPVFGALSNVYWSATSDAGNPGVAWLVLFNDGYVDSYNDKGTLSRFYVRAVRSGP